MAATAIPEVRPDIGQDEKTDSSTEREPGYLVICWNDPVNLMDYVAHVFQIVFGWLRQKADPDAIAEFIKRELPFGRFATPDEIADVVTFVASPRARQVTMA